MKVFDSSAKTNWKFLATIVLLAVITGGGIIWYTNQPEPSSPPQLTLRQGSGQAISNQQPASPAGGSSIDISNWQTYRNEEYGFEFRYPGNWIGRVSTYQDEVFTLDTPENDQLRLDVEAGRINGEGFDHTLSIFVNTLEPEQSNLINYLEQNPEIGDIKSIEFAGRSAFNAVSGGLEAHDNTFIQINRHYIDIFLGYVDRTVDFNLPETKIINQILATFKFIDTHTDQNGAYYKTLPIHSFKEMGEIDGRNYIYSGGTVYYFNELTKLWYVAGNIPASSIYVGQGGDYMPKIAIIESIIYFMYGADIKKSHNEFYGFDVGKKLAFALRPPPLPRVYARLITQGDQLFFIGGMNPGTGVDFELNDLYTPSTNS